jgi:hypothetical protein
MLILFKYVLLYFRKRYFCHAFACFAFYSLYFLFKSLFFSILIPIFDLCYRLLYVIPMFFLCLFSLNVLYLILEKGFFAILWHVWLSTAFTFYLNHCFYSNLIPIFNLCYRLISVSPMFFLCLFSLNMFYCILEKSIFAMPLHVLLSTAFTFC